MTTWAGTPGSPTVRLAVDAQAQVRFTLAFVPGLLDPGSTAVARACGSATAALLVSGADPGPVDDALWANLAAQRQPGPLQRVPRMCLPKGASGFDAANAVIRGALESGLARRDAFVTCGEHPIAQAVMLAAAMFRRHSTAVQVITNLAGLARVLTQGWQASLDHEPVSLPVLAVTAMVDSGRVAHDGPLTHAEAGAARALVARLPASSGLADLLGNVTTLTDATRLRRRLLEVLADSWPALLPSPPASTCAPPGGAGGPACPAPTEHRTRRLSFSVTAETNVLDPQRSSLAGYLPTGARVLAFVDGYREAPVAALDSLLAAYRQTGRIRDFAVHVLPPAPALKSLPTARGVVAHAERMGLGPDDRIVVAGGGTVMDTVGFGAALYRGMTPFIRIPTTLVGLVDGGVGFKVGVDAEGRKNLIGAYHPPAACLCDPQFLKTLPSRELRCGLAEMIKIAAVADGELFELIEDYYDDVLARQQGPSVLRMIRQSIVAMVTDLAVNPCEAQLRRLPDFGHEFGHVLEVTSGMRLRHGEAVALGMGLSCQLASAAGYLAAPDCDRILGLIQRVGLPVHDPACDPVVLWDWLHADVVPHKGGSMHLAVPTSIGAGGFIESVSAIGLPMLADACDRLRDRGLAWLAAQGAS